MPDCQVFIIESVSYDDIYDKRREGEALQKILHLQGVESEYHEIATLEHLEKVIQQAGRESVKYVHFSGHGAAEGFCLTDGTFVTWQMLDEIAWPHLKGKCLCFSSCSVALGAEELFDYHKTFCNVIVAPTRKVGWSEALVAFSIFYFRATNQYLTINQDVKAMNYATRAGTFKVIESSRSTTYVLE